MKKVQIVIDIDIRDGEYELVYKSDTGEGIELEKLQKIVTEVIDNWKMKRLN